MRIIGTHTRVASFVGAVALLVQISPALASDDNHNNRPVAISFTKWGAPPPAVPPTPFFGLFEGLGLIRFGGHLPRGGYDVHDHGRDPHEATSASPVR